MTLSKVFIDIHSSDISRVYDIPSIYLLVLVALLVVLVLLEEDIIKEDI